MIGSMLRREPFRLFFPLGVALAWIGIGHWIAYWGGWIGSYSCLAHGLVQIQGFLFAFALGFLLTALPPGKVRSDSKFALEMQPLAACWHSSTTQMPAPPPRVNARS